MKLFEKRVLRKIFGPNKVTVIGGWRKLHRVSKSKECHGQSM
jgi:hypothetical protein